MQLCKVLFSLVGALATAAQAGDRVYTADQTSNTVSVIDPATNKLLGSIHLGEDVPAALSPLYHGELLVHGLGFSPDHKALDVVSIGSNSVTLIDTESNTVKGKVYVGRPAHEAFFRPDGREPGVSACDVSDGAAGGSFDGSAASRGAVKSRKRRMRSYAACTSSSCF